MTESTNKPLKATKSRIRLRDGRELQYHRPFRRAEPIPLVSLLPRDRSATLEVEIGPGKGEFLAARATKYPNRYFVGIDRRSDRTELTEKKLKRIQSDEGRNWVVLREDARSFLESGLPPLHMLHIYHPDPWPKARHHKHRFFRSPDARNWAEAIVKGGELRLSTDHREYFEEILDIVLSWDFLRCEYVWRKTHEIGTPVTHFEGIFLRKREPVFKAIFRRI